MIKPLTSDYITMQTL